jgi:hypothetical protein
MIGVRCPHCGVGLKVDEGKLPVGISSFACPKCRGSIPTDVLSAGGGGAATEETPTQVLRPVSEGCGELRIEASSLTPEQTYQLKEGTFVIGRRAADGRNDIGIETGDRLMSRSHITIEVRRGAGGGYVHTLRDNGSKNRTYYNGRSLEEGEVVVIKSGDEIMLGQTRVHFVDGPCDHSDH